MATPIRIIRSAVPGKRPQVSDLQVGELALNTYDAELVTVRDRFAATGIATEVVRVGAGVTVTSVIYVTKDGNDNNTGKKLGDAKATIKAAAGISTTGDVIKVSSGVYVEDNPISIPREVSLVGDSLREVTITPQNADKDLFYVGPASMLQELTFSGTVNAGVAAVAFDPDRIEYNPQSPYIRFCTNKITNSIGMKVDGSKTFGPFKSMVTDSYTQYNPNGIGVSLSNEGYAQIVSMFTMNLDVGIAANSGGQCDVTNSNSSFGNYGMISDGIGPLKYAGTISVAQEELKDQFVLDLSTSDRSVSNAVYDSATGLTTVTTYEPHGFEVGMGVTLSKLGFTCSYGDYDHTFVSAASSAVFTGGNYIHSFVSAATSAVNVESGTQSGTELDPSAANYVPSTGVLSLTFESNHNLLTGDVISIDNNSLLFKCARDNYNVAHSYPRSTDPIGNGTTVGITTTGLTTIDLNVGSSTFINHTISTATYTPNDGNLILNVGSGHSFTQSTSHTISTASYTPSTGVLAITITGHGFSSGDYVKLVDESLTWKCSKDSYATSHSYPRISDPAHNKWIAISNVTDNTFDINVGSTTNLNTHQLHGIATNGLIKANSNLGITTDTIGFTCTKDGNNTTKYYPRSTDPISGQVVGVGATTTDTITVNVGVSTHDIFPSGINGYVFDVTSVPTTKSFTVYVGPNRHPHTYVSGGVSKLDIIRPFDGQVVYFDNLYQEVKDLTITNRGGGYTSAPEITISDPSEPWGIKATAVATISDGQIDTIEIVSNGRGYTTTPTVSFASGTASATANMTNKYYFVTKSTPISNGISTITVSDNVPYAVGVGSTVPFYKQSRIIASSHSFEYIGTGVDPLNSLPSRGAVPIQENEVDDRNGGLTIFTSTDQRGEFRIGDGVIINQQTGTISGKFYSKSLFSTLTPFILALGGD